MTAAQPTCWRRKASTGSSVVYGSTTKPSSASCSAAVSSSTASGSNVRSSPITSSLTQSVPKASRASLAVSTASEAVAHPAVLGSTRTPSSSRSESSEPLAGGLDAPDRDRGHGRPRLAQRGFQQRRGWSCRPCREAGARPARPRRCRGSLSSGPGVGTGVVAGHRTTIPRCPPMVARCRTRHPPTALTIAGSDSGGGAGAQADLKTFAALRRARHVRPHRGDRTEHGRGARCRRPRARASCGMQVETVLDDFDVRSVKTGMLATAAHRHRGGRPGGDRDCCPHLVVDPVLVSSSGHRLHGARRRRRVPRPPPPPRPGRHPQPARGGRAGRHRRRVPRDVVEARVAVAERIRATGRPLRRGQGRPPHRVGGRRRGRAPTGSSCCRASGSHTGTTTAPAAPSRPPSPPTWPGAPACPRPSRRPRPSWPGPWPVAPAGGWAPGTAPSTISGGPERP